jgi:hypothetical protein
LDSGHFRPGQPGENCLPRTPEATETQPQGYAPRISADLMKGYKPVDATILV